MTLYIGENGGRGGDGVATGAGSSGQGGAAGTNGDGTTSDGVGGTGGFDRNQVAYFRDQSSFDLIVVYNAASTGAGSGGGGVDAFGGYAGGFGRTAGGGSGSGGGGGGDAQDRYYNQNQSPYTPPPNSIAAGGGGGGGGGNGMVISTDHTIGVNDFLIGGEGGAGGDGKVSLQENRADGGGGGGGGNAVYVSASLTLTNEGTLLGGAGGRGGAGGGAGDGYQGGRDGQGGQGGYGVAVTSDDVTIVNTGTISGGSGAAATGGGGNGGSGGYGIVAPGYGSIGMDEGGDNLTVINSGSISAGRANGGGLAEATGTAIRFGDGGRLVLSSAGVVGTINGAIELNGGVSIETGLAADVDVTLSNAIIGRGGLIKSDAGTLTLSGANSYSGGTTLAGGVLAVSTDANLGAAPTSSQPSQNANHLTFTGGTLEIQQSGTDFISARGVLLQNSGTIQVDGPNQTATFSGVLADDYATGYGASALNKTGDGTLVLTNGGSYYFGMTNIEGGTLALKGDGELTFSAGVALATTATFDISGLNDYTTVAGLYDTADGQAGRVVLGDVDLRLTAAAGSFGGVISGLGGLNIEGGVQTLTGQNAYLGVTTLKGGTLVLEGAGLVGPNDIVFARPGDTNSALVVDGAADPGAGGLFSNTIDNFNATYLSYLAAKAFYEAYGLPFIQVYNSDLLDLRKLTYSEGATAVVTNGVLTVTSGGVSEQFMVDGAGQNSFDVGQDGEGGTLIGIAQLSPIGTIAGGVVTPLSLLAYGGANMAYMVSSVTDANGHAILTIDNGGVIQKVDLGDGALGLSMDFSANTKQVKLTGGDYGDVLKGGSGNDVLVGGRGDDVLNAGGGANNQLYGGEGKDTLMSGAGSNQLYGEAGDDVLTAGDGNNTLSGGDGADILTAGSGRNFLDGGVGDDILSGAGILLGGDGDDVLISKSVDTFFYSYLYGGLGDDVLIGGAGLELMMGNRNDNQYVPDPTARDTVSYENSTVGVTVDLRITGGPQVSAGDASGDYLGDIDNLRGSGFNDQLTGDGNANLLEGRGGDDMLFGEDGKDVLDGGAGDDTLDGGGGNDTYVLRVGDEGDTIVERSGGGIDTVRSAVNVTALAANVERIQLVGKADLFAFGNELKNTIVGNTADNQIDGKAGADVLTGFGGNDTFVFDTALGRTNVDRITDFNLNDATHHDTIALDKTIFAGVGFNSDGSLKDGEFAVIDKTHKPIASAHLFYNTDKGTLYYDADGYYGHNAAAVQVAVFDGIPTLTADDIHALIR